MYVYINLIYCLSFQPPLVQAIFNGDPDEVRALIFKKEDVNVQVKRKVSFTKYRLILF